MEHESTDGGLIERARAGDRDAFEELVRMRRSRSGLFNSSRTKCRRILRAPLSSCVYGAPFNYSSIEAMTALLNKFMQGNQTPCPSFRLPSMEKMICTVS